MIFESHSFNVGWDGNIQGESAPEGVYIYLITYTNRLGELVSKKGSITLLR
jgi:hypothetical protein